MYLREAIATDRLVPVPTTAALYAAILEGDLSGIEAGEGWPVEDSLVEEHAWYALEA